MTVYDGPDTALNVLTLSNASFNVGSPDGTVIGNVIGLQPSGSTLTVVSPAGKVKLVGNVLQVGSTVSSVIGPFNVTLRETNPNGDDSPKDTVISVNVAAVALAVLSVAPTTFAAAAASGTVIGPITGKTAGSALSITVGTGKVAITGNNLTVGTGNTAGALPVTIRETLAGATGTPKDTVINLTVT